MMAPKKTARNTTPVAPTPNDDPNEDDPPHLEADLAKKRSKLISELVSERKKVDMCNRNLLKTIKENEANGTKYRSTINARDRTITKRDVQLVEQKAVVETYKVKLAAKEETHDSNRHEWVVEHDAALAVLNGRLEVKSQLATEEQKKADTATREYATAHKKSKRAEEDLRLQKKQCDNTLSDLHTLKGQMMKLKKLKKELTNTRNQIKDQLEMQMQHKERMKEKDVEQERIKAEKAKYNADSRLLANQRRHDNSCLRTKQRYTKAEDNNLKKHTLKSHSDSDKTDTAVARAAQAAIQVQMNQNAGHFPNLRGVDLERVS
jgi:hypothetical protein